MKHALFASALSLALISCAGAQSATSTRVEIDSLDLKERLAILASDSLEGRRTGEVGAMKAVSYIASEFKRLGLQPVDSAKSYLQPFSFSERMFDSTRTAPTMGANVVGLLPGTDPTLNSEYVIVGAHYDHLGHGGRNALDTSSAIHYGADDNASGTSGVLELAEKLSSMRSRLKRSVLFITFSGEEEGLFGSIHFTKNPLIPLAKVVAMINMDMIGRLSADSVLILEGMGSSPEFRPLAERLNTPKQFNLKLKDTPIGPSDHASFYRKDLPVLFFFTGLHKDYHRASDTRDKINYSGMERILTMAEAAIIDLANRSERIAFTRVKEDTTQKTTGFSVYVGGVPDYGYEGKGVKISAVNHDSPAAKAGMRENDVIVEFDGHRIETIFDYTGALSKKKPGDQVKIGVFRESAIVYLDLTLGKRGSEH